MNSSQPHRSDRPLSHRDYLAATALAAGLAIWILVVPLTGLLSHWAAVPSGVFLMAVAALIYAKIEEIPDD